MKLPRNPFAAALAVLAIAVSVAPAARAQAPQYVVTVLPFSNFGVSNFDVRGVNNFGQVAVNSGYYDSFGYHESPYMWDAGITTYQGSLGGDTAGVRGINNKGQMSGYGTNSSDVYRGFIAANGALTDLGRNNSYGYAINYGGQVAGAAKFGVFGTYYAAALYSGGTWQELGGFADVATAINNFTQVTGYGRTVTNITHAFQYASGTVQDLGTLGGTNSYGFGINDAGTIVGRSEVANGDTHAFIYYGGAMRDLGTLGGTHAWAIAINTAGQVLGNSATASGTDHGFLRSGGAMYDLNNTIAAAQSVTGIPADDGGNNLNDQGQIATRGIYGGSERAILMTPRNMGTAFSGGLGDMATGSDFSVATAVANGGVVAGGVGNKTANNSAFSWTLNQGIFDIANATGSVDGTTLAVTADGHYLAGSGNASGTKTAFRYDRVTDTYLSLGVPSGYTNRSVGYGISADGTKIAGFANNATGSYQPFLWTQSSGWQGLGWLPGSPNNVGVAYAISSDGSTVVGDTTSANSGAANNEAFRWTQAGGMVGLGDLPGGLFLSTARAASKDGSVIAGQGRTAAGGEAFRWTEATGMVSLGDLPGGATYSFAYGVSGDGKIVVGEGSDAGGGKAFVWDAKTGMRNLQSVLNSEYGVIFDGWTLTSANAISVAGDSIAGAGTDPFGHTQAFVAQINSRTYRFVSGETYAGFHTSRLGGFGSALDLVGGTAAGTAGSFRTVTADFITPTATTGGLASDVVALSGTGSDLYVVQMAYDAPTAVTLYGSEAGLILGWWNGTAWVNALQGNTGSSTGVAVSGAYDGSLAPGRYGVDTVNKRVWAVVNHGGQFAALNEKGWDRWRAGRFTPAQLADTGTSGDDADPNGNGIRNLLEYSLGGDPVGSTTGLGILPQVGRSAGNTLQISFTRFLDRSDLTLTAYAADSLTGPWTPLARSTAGGTFVVLELGATAPEGGAGNTRTVTVTDLYLITDPAHPQRFLKLEVTR